MEKNPLRTLAEIAAIIACIIAVLTFFNIQPSCSSNKDVNNTEVLIPTEEHIIEDTTDTEDNLNQIINDETEFSVNASDEVSLWDIIKLPFVKHQKKNYFKLYRDKKAEHYLFAFVVLFIFLIPLDLILLDGPNPSEDRTVIFSYLIAAVLNIIVAWYILVFRGVF